MKLEIVNAFSRALTPTCRHIPDGYARCENGGFCATCLLGDRIRRSQYRATGTLPLFGWRDALPQTPSTGGENWYSMPVILSPEAMDRCGLRRHLLYQIVVAVDGPGLFKKNVCGDVDAYLLCDRTRFVTVSRRECFGIPTQRAADLYDRYFFLELGRLLKQRNVAPKGR